jgi:protein-tyrosine phosphatase
MADKQIESTFEIVVVCTGNQFRSPILEGLLTAGAGEFPVRVSSVGTADLGPAPALPEAVRLAAEFGVDLKEHRARYLRNLDLSAADLVIGFEVGHLAEAVIEANAPRGKTFMLTELVDLLEEIPEDPPGTAEGARAAVALADELRSSDALMDLSLQIADPVGGPADGFRTTAQSLRALSERLVRRLFGSA